MCNEKAKVSRKSYNPFTFDFDSLYDRISPDLAYTALQDAMQSCRPSWSSEFQTWLLELIAISIEASIGEYCGKLFRSYTFSGTVYSQGLRLCRIINDDARLQIRLNELGEDFIKCKYPPQMIQKILQKVANTTRTLDKKEKSAAMNDKVMIVST